MNDTRAAPSTSYGRGALWGIAAALLVLVLLMVVAMILFNPEMTAA